MRAPGPCRAGQGGLCGRPTLVGWQVGFVTENRLSIVVYFASLVANTRLAWRKSCLSVVSLRQCSWVLEWAINRLDCLCAPGYEWFGSLRPCVALVVKSCPVGWVVAMMAQQSLPESAR